MTLFKNYTMESDWDYTGADMDKKTDVSVVIPAFNESESLVELHEQVVGVLTKLGLTFEIIFINDGSTDGSAEILNTLADQGAHTWVAHFSRNYGKAAALDFGFKQAKGWRIVTLDADLQDDPAEIPRMLAEIEKGYDLVSGHKVNRQDPVSKTLPSKFFNWVLRKVSGLKLHDFNCGFKVYRKSATEGLSLYGDLHRYIPVFVAANGFKVTELGVHHRPRKYGHSKYGITRLWKGFFDLLTVILLTRYRTRPLHLFGGAGFLMSLFGMGILAYLSVLWFLGERPIGTRPLFFLGLLLVMVGVQLISTGLLAEMIQRSSARDRQDYLVREVRRKS